MNKLEEIQKVLLIAGKGKNIHIEYYSDPKALASAKKAGIEIKKKTCWACRVSISYANLQENMGKSDSGSHELPWGHWLEGWEGKIIEHKNVFYLRIYKPSNKAKSHSTYTANEKEVSKKDLLEDKLISSAKGQDKPCRDIKVENIIHFTYTKKKTGELIGF